MNLSAKFFVFLAAITGMISAFIAPIMSYFLVEGLSLPAYYIGIYTVTLTTMTVIVSQILGRLADKGFNSKRLYLIGTFCLALVGIVYSQSNTFTTILLAAILLMPFGGSAIPQLLTLSRFWAEKHESNIPSFNAKVRSGISVAWVVGPPSAFALVSVYGFSGSFLVSSMVAIVAFSCAAFLLPNDISSNVQSTSIEEDVHGHYWFLAIAILLGMMSNLTYSSGLPLYLMKELNQDETVPGLLMGLVAAMEIPIMLLATRLAAKFSQMKVFSSAFIFALIFYLAMYFAEETWQFFALQPINALFYGLYAGLGLTLLQQAVPNRAGFTSALYSNLMKIGVMTGTSITGLIGYYGTFKMTNLAAATMAVLAVFCLILHHNQSRKAINRAQSS